MSTPEQPEWLANLNKGMADFAASATQFNCTMIAQAAMGWLYRGDIALAKTTLEQMPADRLLEVSAAATALAELADERAREVGGG